MGRRIEMRDVMQAVTGNKMLDLKRELHDLRELLAKADDPDKIKVLKKTISEKETYYNILADRARVQ